MFNRVELETASHIIYESMRPTAQYAWPLLASRVGATVWVKHENHTPTGAFKVRGGLVYMAKHSSAATRTMISATRGNHGQSLAFAARRFGARVIIYVPHGNSAEKNAAMRAFGAELVEVGADFDEARLAAETDARTQGAPMIPSFHPTLVLGVATYALELFGAVADLDTVYVPIGMGSGICGVIRTRDLLGLKTKVVGVVSSEAPAFGLSFASGKIVTTAAANTFADGMACRIPVPDALAQVRAGAERIVTVTETEIAAAVRAYYTDTHNLAEGAGAAALAALMQERTMMAGRNIGVILSGGNIDLPLFSRIMSETESAEMGA